MTNDVVTFEQIYKRYSNDVFRFALWLCGNIDDAKDITSETFVRLWTSENDIRFETLKSYLFTIARNVYLHQIRKSKNLTSLTETHEEILKTTDPTIETNSELAHILHVIQSLPKIDRMVLLMRAEEELSYEEIAAATGLSLSAVKVKVFRARTKLLSLRKSL